MRKALKARGLEDRFDLDSAGTHAYHVGECPDSRAVSAAAARDIDISGLRARRAVSDDFRSFDYILAMDEDNLVSLERISPSDGHANLALFMSFAGQQPTRSVPDPYYGGEAGFERVLDMLELAAEAFLDRVLPTQ